MAKKEERFVKTYGQGVAYVTEIWVDREGKPVITSVYPEE
jgi:hypothetical protein